MDAYLEKLTKLMSSRKIGDPSDKSTFQGPQGDKKQQQNVLEFIEEGKQAGELVYSGEQPQGKVRIALKRNRVYKGFGRLTRSKGAFVPPTIFKNVKTDSRPFQEEIFGPVVIVNSFKTEDEAIAVANDTEYGLHGRRIERAALYCDRY